MKTQIGEMRFCVTVQKCTNVKGTDGAFTKTWTERCKDWAAIKPLSSSENQQSKQVVGEATHAIRMRYNDEILLSDRILNDSHTYYIISILNIDLRGRFMELQVKENQA